MNPLPTHVAIIPDGNGRWAQQRGLSRVEGHRRGVEVVDDIVTAARELGVRYLTIYSFSDENWARPAEEVEALMVLLDAYLRSKREKMCAQRVRLRTIGDTSRLPAVVQAGLRETMAATAGGDALTLVLALSYGARAEICRAFARAVAAGVSTVTPEQLGAYLDTAEFPEPELLIRTSGEWRISNFLLWQLAYTELNIVPQLWPDFTAEDFRAAVAAYQQRERRFGRVTS
ncbi:MAG: di-trans,poly-cis-decaprenylcistransferase [Deltaproteobacteria bacterium]|nr:di-trans,poly-cis-decaprenylcistransferase [Deltaproteobacteria bacterium]